MQKKIRVLIVDDSAVVRQTLARVISSDAGLEVVASASDPFAAAEKIREAAPDVITLDIEMPRMDGITFLQKIMKQHPIPVVIISSLAESGSETALKALEYGAVDIVQKPHLGAKQFFEESGVILCNVVKAAASARLKPRSTHPPVPPKITADAVLARSRVSKSMIQTTEKVVVVGASTGGTEALKVFLRAMPPDAMGIAVVQHMPEKFTTAFARQLDSICGISVKEAEDNDSLIRGRALIAPGNRHMILKRSGARYYVEIKDGPLVSRHRPSADVLFRSAAEHAGKNAIGVILTGMGDDGSHGMLEMKQSGAFNIAQDEESCVVFGMPKEAIKKGAVDAVLPLEMIAAKVIEKTCLP
ncbi:MAG: chemotaxis response regulator protein-glutamate methylesterase [Deltaproteobacteria bacterium]|nr:chemotaxis response regulator protein-glutamate methylesterase [Deltaproteobacteria bacterium]